jgi:hypothetical protein
VRSPAGQLPNIEGAPGEALPARAWAPSDIFSEFISRSILCRTCGTHPVELCATARAPRPTAMQRMIPLVESFQVSGLFSRIVPLLCRLRHPINDTGARTCLRALEVGRFTSHGTT